MTDFLTNQSEYIDMMARSVVYGRQGQDPLSYTPPVFEPTQLDQMAQAIVQNLEPATYDEYLTNTGRYMVPLEDPTGQRRMREDWKQYHEAQLQQVHREALKKYTVSAGKEAVLAEFSLLPGMAVLGAKLTAEGAKQMASFGALGLGAWIANRIKKPPEEPISTGPQSLPLEYKLMMPWAKAYEEMVDAEADLVVATDKYYSTKFPELYGDRQMNLLGGATAVAAGHTGTNMATMALNPAGKISRIAARGLGLSVRGAIWGASALAGNKLARKMFSGLMKNDAVAKNQFAKTFTLLSNIGRGPNPVVAAEEVAEGIGRAAEKREAFLMGRGLEPAEQAAERRAAVQGGDFSLSRPGAEVPTPIINPGSNLNPLEQRVGKILTDFQLMRGRETRASAEIGVTTDLLEKQAALPPAHIFDRLPVDTPQISYISPEDLVALRKAEGLDQVIQNQLPLGMQLPAQSTNLYREAQRIARQFSDGTVLGEKGVSQLDLAEEAIDAVKGLVENPNIKNTESGKLLSTAVKEMERIAAAEKAAPGSVKQRVPSVREPVWKRQGVAGEAQRIAEHYVANRDVGMLDAAINYQRLLQDIPDKAVREDIIALMERTGNPWKGANDTLANVEARLRDSGMLARAEAWAKQLRERYDIMWREINELNAEIGDKAVDYADDWLHHMWLEPINEAKAKISRIKNRQLPATAKMEKHRHFETYFDGVIQGKLTPRTRDAAELYALVEAQYSRAMAVKQLVKEINELGVTEGGEKAFMRIMKGEAIPEGYVQLRSAFTNRIGSEMVPAEILKDTKVVIHKDMARHLRNILEQPSDPNAFYKLSAMAKRANFMFAFFHMYSLGESSIAALGPVRGMRVNAGIIRNMGRRDWYTGEALQHLIGADSFKRAWESAAYHGVKLGVPMHDVMRDQFENAALGVVRRLKEGPKKEAAAKALDTLFGVQHRFDSLVWEKYHTPMKVIAFDNLYSQLKAVRDGALNSKRVWNPLKKAISEMDDETLGREVGRFINDEFGGQNWEIATRGWFENVISKPENLRLLSAIFISPDWNLSSLKAGLSVVQAVPGLKTYNPVRGYLGIQHWRNASLGYLFYANIMNKALAGHYIWENEPGKRLFHLDTGVRDDNGKPIYINVGKQFRELPDAAGVEIDMATSRTKTQGTRDVFGKYRPSGVHIEFRPLAGTTNFLSKKTMPWIQSGIENSQEFYELTYDFLQEGKELGLDESVIFALRSVLEGFMPFSIGGATTNTALSDLPAGPEGLAARAAAGILPASRGANDTALAARLAMSLREQDYKQFNELTAAIADSRGQDKAFELANKARQLVRDNPNAGELEEVKSEGTPHPAKSNFVDRLRNLFN